jgi:death on curing protein
MNYLSPQEILYIHSRVIEELGGNHGANDILVLKKLIKYIHNAEIFPDVFSKIAALFFGIAKKRPFSTRNFQTGVIVLEMFLNLNKYSIDIESSQFHKFIDEDFARAKVEDIRKFLIQNSFPI